MEEIKKELPVPIYKQFEVPVDYAIAKFMYSGIAFKSKQNDYLSKCWIKYYDKQKQFHLTLRFKGVDYITKKGTDNFDIDLYIPFEDFLIAFEKIIDNIKRLSNNDINQSISKEHIKGDE